ncbi:amino acid decarboxylase [Lapidilactobacillus mulanensis]|uniref:Amino acid decarboxylase n=1 Tax=Lapidilactobacillus mulanensis TaxID=2485999 RepID=A0ABW4DMA2_9LACO|nr:amino acid decarboxylase [Lapidilactobacillus mulanensis]
MKQFIANAAGYQITAELNRASQDVAIFLTGGDVPHYGVTTVLTATQAPESYRFASRPGHHHEEYVLTERLGKLIQPALQGNCTIIGGVHVNNISREQMKAAYTMVNQLGAEIKQWLLENPVDKPVEMFAQGSHQA